MDDIGARTVFAVIFYLLGVDLAEIDCLMLRLDFSRRNIADEDVGGLKIPVAAQDKCRWMAASANCSEALISICIPKNDPK